MSGSDIILGDNWALDGQQMTLFGVTVVVPKNNDEFPLWTGSRAPLEGGPKLVFGDIEKAVQAARRTGWKEDFHVSVKPSFALLLARQGQLPAPTMAAAKETEDSITVTLMVYDQQCHVKIWGPKKSLPREVAAYDDNGLLI